MTPNEFSRLERLHGSQQSRGDASEVHVFWDLELEGGWQASSRTAKLNFSIQSECSTQWATLVSNFGV